MGVRRSNIFRARPFVVRSLLSKLRFIEHPDPTALAARLAAEFPPLDLGERVAKVRSTVRGRVVFTTSFGIEDQAIAHAVFTRDLAVDVVTLDTGRLFPQTYELWAETERRYCRRIRAVYPERQSLEALVARQGVNGFYGMPVQVLPSGQRTLIEHIVTADGDLAFAFAGQAVTLTFADEIDASRGDVVAEIGPPAPVTNWLCARLVWIGTDALVPGRTYLLKLAAATVKATIEPGLQVVDLDTHNCAPAERLVTNDIGTAVIGLDRGISADRYVDTTDTGSFILIDPESFETVCLGIVEAVHPGERRTPTLRTTTLYHLVGATETHARSVAKAISWRATGSLDTFIVAIAITGSSKLAGGVALAEVVTKTGLYYLHERIWASVPWGKR